MGVKLLFRCQLCKDGFDLQLGDFRGLVDDHNTTRRHCGGRSRELVELSQLLACPRNDLSLGKIYIYIYIFGAVATISLVLGNEKRGRKCVVTIRASF